MKNKDTLINLDSKKLAKLLIRYNADQESWEFPNSLGDEEPCDFGWYGCKDFPIDMYDFSDIVDIVSDWLDTEINEEGN